MIIKKKTKKKTEAGTEGTFLITFNKRTMTVAKKDDELLYSYIAEALNIPEKVRHSRTDWMEKKGWYGRLWNNCGKSLGSSDFMFICNALSEEGGEVTVESDSHDISLELLAADVTNAGAEESVRLDG